MKAKTIDTVLAAILLLGGLGAAPGTARAGWVVDWTNTATKLNGDHLSSESARMYIEKGKVRLEQPTLTTVMDYGGGRFTVLNPGSRYFWSGKVEDYVRQAAANRQSSMTKRAGKSTPNYGLAKIDEDKLPHITIKETPDTGRVAEHDVRKFEVLSNGELFQELWLATDIDMKSDLKPEEFLAYQRKMSAGMLGWSAGPFNALHRSKDYASLLGKGFVLRSIIHHRAGHFEKRATAIKRADVEASEFDVPETYRRVRIKDVFPKPEEDQNASGR